MPSCIELHPTICPICRAQVPSTELHQANFDFRHFNPAVFSARRLPDGIHYRMVRCNGCGLVRADPAADPKVVADLYSKSGFDYAEESANLRRTYGRYLKKVENYTQGTKSLLEIGCGNGFFLEKALSMGYTTAKGVEPSMKAVEASNPRVRPNITCEMMRPGLFSADEFDVICMFQLLDHISDPASFLEECFKVLKPGGLVLSINHDMEAVSATLLGKASPIFDIEHTFLFSKRTAARLFEVHNFEVKRTGLVLNSYTVRYLMHLAPIPTFFKEALVSVLVKSGLGRMNLSLPLGNLYLIAQKPATQRDSLTEGSE